MRVRRALRRRNRARRGWRMRYLLLKGRKGRARGTECLLCGVLGAAIPAYVHSERSCFTFSFFIHDNDTTKHGRQMVLVDRDGL